MATYISPDITTGTYVRARLVVEYSANASSNNNSVRAYVQMWRTNTGFTTSGSGKLYIGVDGYGWAESAITDSQKITYNSYTVVGSPRDLTIAMDGTGRWVKGFHIYATSDIDNISFSQQSFGVELEPCPVYGLSISAGTGSSVTVNRTSSPKGSTGNLSAGTKKLYYGDKLQISFTPSTNYSITTHTVNGAAFTSGGTHTVSGDVAVKATATPLKSLVAATDANIGSTSSVLITRYNNSYTHTLTYKFGNLTGTIATKTAETTVPFPVPVEFYDQIPNDPSGICTITCETYNGNTSLGSTPCTMTVTAAKNLCSPIVSVEAADSNEATFALTGDTKKIIRYHSDIAVNATVDIRNGAKIKSTTLKCGGAIASGTSYTFLDAESIDISATAIDSRDYDKTDYAKELTLIEYIKLTTNAEAARTGPTSDEVIVSAKGSYYNGSFGAVNNTLALQVKYKPKSEENFEDRDDWPEMTVTLDGNTYTAEATLTGLDYTQLYDIRVQASDQIYKENGPLANAVYHNISLNKGVPVFDWGEEDFNFNVPISIQSQPVEDFIIEQGTTDIWTYEKWASGKAVCWSKISTSSGMIGMFNDEQSYKMISLATLPFEFIETPIINATSTMDGGLGSYGSITCYIRNLSTTEFALCQDCTPNIGYIYIDCLIIGKWK